jgi:reactive intermediate/imine deaminase
MSGKSIIQTDDAPAAIGPYSQAVRSGELIFLSGQIPLDPETMQIVADDVETQARQVFSNLQAVASAADSSLDRAVKLTIYMTDLGHFSTVNDIMAEMLKPPYPARATIEVSALPKGALVEIDAILAG